MFMLGIRYVPFFPETRPIEIPWRGDRFGAGRKIALDIGVIAYCEWNARGVADSLRRRAGQWHRLGRLGLRRLGPLLPLGFLARAYRLDRCWGKAANDDQQSGIDIVRRALRAPARQIADNAGEDGAWIVGKLLENEDYGWGFNAATGEYQDLVKAGVIDPAKVVRTALQDAASVASLLITTEALVAELPKEEKASAMSAMDF